jgi:hypothetical protein
VFSNFTFCDIERINDNYSPDTIEGERDDGLVEVSVSDYLFFRTQQVFDSSSTSSVQIHQSLFESLEQVVLLKKQHLKTPTTKN